MEAKETFKHVFFNHVCRSCDATDPCKGQDCPVTVQVIDPVDTSRTQAALTLAKAFRYNKAAADIPALIAANLAAEETAAASLEITLAADLAVAGMDTGSGLASRIAADLDSRLEYPSKIIPIPVKITWTSLAPLRQRYILPKRQILPDPDPVGIPKLTAGVSIRSLTGKSFAAIMGKATKIKR
jgi:hypothetical protein